MNKLYLNERGNKPGWLHGFSLGIFLGVISTAIWFFVGLEIYRWF